jgi:hypothetical protein
VHRGLHAALAFIHHQVHQAGPYFGLGPAWLAIPLVIVGLVTIAALGRLATALAAAALWPEMIALSALRKYPLLDLRTSTFLFAVTAVVAAIGVAGIGLLAWRLLRGGRAAQAAAGLLAAAALAGLITAADPYVRVHAIPAEDVRDQAHYVLKHAAPADVIVVNLNSNWGFAYYWPVGPPARRPSTVVLQGYEAYFPGQPRIIVARNRDQAGVSAALAAALARSRQHGCSAIWLVRAHVNAGEQAAWRTALSQDGVASVPVTRSGLRVIRPSGRACAG